MGLILLPNVVVEVTRSRYQKNTGITALPQINLTGISGNLSPMTMSDYTMLSQAPEPAMRSNYLLLVPTRTDIITGDAITKIFELDGVTPWAGAGPQEPGQIGYGNVLWWVRFYAESAPRLLPYRSIYLERVQVGGPA